MLRNLVQNYEKKNQKPVDVRSVPLAIIRPQNNTIGEIGFLSTEKNDQRYHLPALEIVYFSQFLLNHLVAH